MSRREILERERRRQRLAGYAAIAAAPLYIGSLFAFSSAGVPLTGMLTERLRAIDEVSGQVLVAGVVSAVALALTTIPLYYLFRAAQARSERDNPAMVGFVFLGPLLYAAQRIVAAFSQTQLASDFVDKSAAGGDIYTLADDLIDENTLGQVGSYLLLPALLALIVAMIYVALNAMRVGLLTRFHATLGMALAASQILIQPDISLLALTLWFAWLGFVILDRVPRGRPPAWDAGEAVPWPRPGEEPRPAVAAEAPVEGDATEVFTEPVPQDHSARRERARKRKRKRRR